MFYASLLMNISGYGQFVDSCFTSAAPHTSFVSSGSLANTSSVSADLLEWSGNSWIGTWPTANITLPPPSNAIGCRAIWVGNSVNWTTGGESFCLRLIQPLVDGQLYSFRFTYVSHGLYSSGAFMPYISTNNSPSMGSAYSLGQLPAVGFSWTTNVFTFTATAAQAGHNWVILGTAPDGSSGMFSSLCSSCGFQQALPLQCSLNSFPAACMGVCDGSSNATVSGGQPPYHYLWQATGDTTASMDSLCQGGTYRLTVTDFLGATVTDSVYIPIITPQNAEITSNVSAICTGDTAFLCATAGFLTYRWNTGATSPCVSDVNGGNYTVTVTDNNSCSVVSNPFSVTIHPLPIVSIQATQTIFCSGDSAQVCASSDSFSYLWNNGATSSCISALHAGNYYVTVTDTNNCSAVSNHLAIYSYPIPSISISVNGDTLNSYNGVSYQWYFNGQVINGANTSMEIAKENGLYTVEITDSNGCHTISNPVNIVVSDISSIHESLAEFRIYPNPATESITISVDVSLIGSALTITDVTGREVLHSAVQIRNPQFEIRNFSSGVYFVTVANERGKMTKKLVKQ